jgi:hypothetical protein
MRERESLTSITRKRVLNRFDHRLHSHGRWPQWLHLEIHRTGTRVADDR